MHFDNTVSDSTRLSRTLVFWDIDYTLVGIGGDISKAIYASAFRKVTGRQMHVLADLAGRTEQAIIIETMYRNGIGHPQQLFADFCSALAESADEMVGKIRDFGKVMPGARQALDVFSEHRIVQSTVTGNIRPIAETKLDVLGLANNLDFTIGGYGDDSHDRVDLVALARQRAAKTYGSFPDQRTVVIGDTPHDIRAARAAGVVAVGVATGQYSLEELVDAGADTALNSLTDYPRILNILGRK